MWAYGMGQSYGTPSWNQSYNYSGPSWDQSANYAAQTGPSYSSGSGMWGNVGGAVLNGIGGYFQAQAAAKQQEELAKLDAQTQKEILQQQRDYQTQDREFRRGAVSKWSKFFGD